MIKRDISQVLEWHDVQGVSGLNSILAVVAHLLKPSKDEAGGLVIGDLIIHLLRGAGDGVIPILPDLLRTMVERMKTAKTATFLQVSEVARHQQ